MAKQKDKVGSKLGSKDPNLGRMAGGVYEETAEVSLKVLDKYVEGMAEDKRNHIRKEALSCSFRALDNFACARMWTSFQRVLDLVDLMSWEMTPEESAEFNVVRLRIDIVNGDRGMRGHRQEHSGLSQGEEVAWCHRGRLKCSVLHCLAQQPRALGLRGAWQPRVAGDQE